MNQAVDTLGHAHESAKIGEAGDLASDPAADRMIDGKLFPGICGGLLEAQ